MYPIRRMRLNKGAGFYSTPFRMGNVPVFWTWILTFLLLVSSGVTYRVLATRLKYVADTPVKLPVSLNAFPQQIGHWEGKDVPIPPNVQRAAGNDDFLNRLFINKYSNQWANIYIAYTARPRTMLGHQPEVCYVAGGWVHEETELTKVTSNSGRELPCLLHRFRRPYPETEQTVVLNFYIVNGRLTCDESVFSGVGFRTPNIEGDPARYVTQVQISSVFENSVRSATKDIADLILDFFPNENGKVRAIEYAGTSIGAENSNSAQKIE